MQSRGDEAKMVFLGEKGPWRQADGKAPAMQNGAADDEKIPINYIYIVCNSCATVDILTGGFS